MNTDAMSVDHGGEATPIKVGQVFRTKGYNADHGDILLWAVTHVGRNALVLRNKATMKEATVLREEIPILIQNASLIDPPKG